MIWQKSILVTAEELFSLMQSISPQCSVKTRYDALRRVLTTAIEQQLAEVTIKLSGLYAKLDYLIKLHKLRENDRSLSFALNAMRKRLEGMAVMQDSELEPYWQTDYKAVAQFISLTYDVPLPHRLNEVLEKIHFKKETSFATRHTQAVGDNIKCIVTDFDNNHIQATCEATDQTISIAYTAENPYVPGDWSYLKRLLSKGMVLNVVRPRRAKNGDILPELIILLPDYLINVTSVAGCFDDLGHTPFADLLSKLRQTETTMPILLGNFAGQLLDEEAYHKQTTYNESIKEFFKNNALSIAACDDMDSSFHTLAKEQKENIRHLLRHDYEQQTSSKFRTDRVILEPSFFSDLLGLQGRMDFLDLSYRTIIEQKSGKCKWQPGADGKQYSGKKESHYVQLLLYRALLHYDYKRLTTDDMQTFLLYSRYANGLDMVTSAPLLLFEAMKIRNQLAWCQQWFAMGGLRVLETLTPEKIYPSGGGVLWTRYKRPQIMEILAPIQEATAVERAYYARFMEFIANEQALAKIGNHTKENAGFASVWNTSLEEKREAGNIFENMRIDATSFRGEEVENLCFLLSDTTAEKAADLSNFRRGDIVFFYPYDKGTLPDATSTMVFRCSITNLTAQKVEVRMRNAQTSSKVFEYFKGKVWAMEHDFLESSYTAQYRGLQAFLNAPQQRRDLLLKQRLPLIDKSRHRMGNYGGEEFNALVEHAMQATDLYLVIGPPGTGKTSFGMKNILIDELLHPDTNVLLLSYTNRAVDEICSKLVEIEGLDFIRIGNDYSCEPIYHPYLLGKRIEQMEQPNKQAIINLIRKTRVFCGTITALSTSLSLFRLKQFSLSIVDEASQILEPHLLPLLSAVCNGESAIKRFVLIGDEKQLPAVVQQSERESVVNNPLLTQIGLTDCRLSLFERLLHIYAYRPDGTINEEVCHLLTHQGRMHREIASFPCQAFYENQLSEVPLPHQIEATPKKSNHFSWLRNAVETSRVAFINYSLEVTGEEPDKINQTEANIITQLVNYVYRLHEKDFSAGKTIGIIVPYRNQIATIRKAISMLHIEPLNDITIDTVERYQGSQRDYIVYGFTVKQKYQLSFLTNHEYQDKRTGSIIDRKLNVAMTRARKHLLLVGNASLLSCDYTFSKLINYTKEQSSFFSV